ncbi:Digeranylgeranylglycerophospholipid reductase [Candidatus Bilamarchaeum dharawalense]|uniref:Digeranylgeranylglycerophospholipid reductase n=1 Tax=Candidatus Bilamarchaeum dharawalense TaxID=2885759 RepID=A0A5E4LUR6_9ARCH|nr:Digeranylgeranylglycerophospholipid reductase [Candidatus Bilamarchaeum dharawalense]
MEFDVIVLGGGPSGSSCASFLSKTGRKVLLLDRAKFPREKTCGDGISGRSVSVLRELGILDQFKKVEHEDMFGVTFSSPNGIVVPVAAKAKTSPGFVCRREVFDNVVFNHAKSVSAKTLEGFIAQDLIFDGQRVVGVKGTHEGKQVEFKAKVVVGADGAAGITARKLGSVNDDPAHQCSGVRCYYEGVEGMEDKIELHFVKEAIPGYFWIFPLPGKKANVGLGMMVRDIKKNKVNLQKIMFDIIENNPTFKPRFAKAKRTTEVKSWLLPYATKRTKIAGDGYVLVGDAASLIDPFTGEGVGNALISGKIAAKVINEAFVENDFSEKKLSQYQNQLFDLIGGEINSNYRMQKLSNNPFLLNLVIGRAAKSNYVKGVISDALLNPHDHAKLVDPLFFFKALFS